MKKTIVTIGTAALVLIGSTFTIEPAQVAAERNIDNLKTEQNKLNSKISKVETNIKDILKDIQKIHNEIVALEAEVKENKALIKEVEGQINEHEAEVDKINKRIDERSEILKGRIASYQQSGGNIQFLEVLLGAKNISQFISRVESVTTMTGADQELIDEQAKDLIEVERVVDELNQMKADYEGIHDELEYNLREQEEAKKKIERKEKDLTQEKNKLEGDLQTVNSDIAALEAEIRAQMNQSVQSVARTQGNSDDVAQSSVSRISTNSNNSNNTNNGNSNTNKTNKTNNTPKINVDTSSVISTARSATGVGYKTAGSSLSGFDCSGYVSWVYSQHGVSLPRTAAGMAAAGQKISLSEAKPGDLAIFRNGGHVGIYLGNGQFIGSQTSTGVAQASLTSGYWKENFDYIVRVK